MKTAMQEMIDWLKSQEDICISNVNQYQADFINGHILVSLPLLEEEKAQITNAFVNGMMQGTTLQLREQFGTVQTPEQFYNEKYTDNETNT